MAADGGPLDRLLPRRRQLEFPSRNKADDQSFGAPYVLLLSLAAANVTGATKKAVTSGAIFIGYNVGNIASA